MDNFQETSERSPEENRGDDEMGRRILNSPVALEFIRKAVICSYKICKDVFSYEEMFSIAAEQFIKCLRNYNPFKGAAFSTYADMSMTWKLRGAALRERKIRKMYFSPIHVYRNGSSYCLDEVYDFDSKLPMNDSRFATADLRSKRKLEAKTRCMDIQKRFPNEYKILFLYYVHRYSIKELAKKFHCSPSAMQKRLERAMLEIHAVFMS